MIKYLSSILNNKFINNFIHQAESDTLSHAYIVVAQDELSLGEILKAMTAIIYCDHHNACGECINCLRLAGGNHPNVHDVPHISGDIKVGDVQDIINTLDISSLENGYATIVIERADKMNSAAQNKLLKTLEEPREDAILLLGVVNENALLPTIKSRARTMYINVWDTATIHQELSERAQELTLQGDESATTRLPFAIEMCGNSIQKGMELLSNQEYYTRFLAVYNMIMHLDKSSEVAEYNGVLGVKTQDTAIALSMLETIFAKALHSHINNSPDEVAQRYNYNSIVNIEELIITLYSRVESNCQLAAIEYGLMMGVLEIRYKTR